MSFVAHMLRHPSFPYAVGYPLVRSPESPPLNIGAVVSPISRYITNRIKATCGQIKAVRQIKYYRREGYIDQVQLVDQPNDWYYVGHFKKL